MVSCFTGSLARIQAFKCEIEIKMFADYRGQNNGKSYLFRTCSTNDVYILNTENRLIVNYQKKSCNVFNHDTECYL